MPEQTPAQNAAALLNGINEIMNRAANNPDGTPRDHSMADTIAAMAVRAQQATAASLLAVAEAIKAHTEQQREEGGR